MSDNSFNYIGLHTYGKTIDNKAAVEVYWDLSGANCLFSRDYTRYNNTDTKIGLSSSEKKINQFIYPYGARPILDCSTVATSEGWKNGVIYNTTDCSNIFITTQVKTPSFFSSINNLFLLGSTTSNGGYIGGLKDGVPFFGIQGDLNSTKKIGAFSDCSDVCHQFKGITDISGDISNNPQDFKLSPGKKYELEYYYKFDSSKCLINVKNLESQSVSGIGDYSFTDISNSDPSGTFGFVMENGNLSIGTTSHVANSNLWNGEIYKMSIYANDISKIPLFDLSRNGFILDDCSQNKYSSFYDNSGNTGLIIEPNKNEYQVKFTDPSYSGQSYIKETILHDIYYFQRITGQDILPLSNSTDLNTTYTKQIVTVMDKFNKKSEYNNSQYYEMWAGGYDKTNNIIKPRLWNSIDGGESWNIIENWTLGTDGEQILDLKTYIDPYGGKWVFVCGENYMLHTTNNYDTNGLIGGEILGSTWQIIYDNSGNDFEKPLRAGTTKRLAISTINVVDINETQSNLIFPNANNASNNSFHLWLGTFDYFDKSIYGIFQPGNNINITLPSGFSWPQEIWWTLEDSNGNLVIETRPSNGATGAPYNNGSSFPPNNNPSLLIGCPYNQNHFLANDTYTLKLYDSYGDGWHGTPMIVTNLDTNTNLFPSGNPTNTYSSFPEVAPDVFSFTLFTPSEPYPNDNPGYRDILIRGSYDDFKNDTLDYSHNIITNQILELSGNSGESFDIETFNSFSFGGNYTDNKEGLNYGIITTNNYIFLTKNGGLTWDKKLQTNRIGLFGTSNNVRGTLGSYVEKNKKNGSYDNSGMYVQTSTEPWNGLPGLTLAYNNSDYDLSFNLNPLKTWDPSLNANSFWNVNIPDNSGVQVLYRGGGGNTIKTYISDDLSPSIYEKKQQMWTFDSCIPGIKNITENDYQQSSLYLKDSEIDGGDSWQRITPTIVDETLNNSYPYNNSLRWDGFTPYDCSYSIINLPFSDINGKIKNNFGDNSQYLGFYKLSKTPYTPFIVIEQSPSDIYTVNLIIKYLKGDGTILNPAEYNARLNFDKLNIKPKFQVEVKSDVSIPWTDQWVDIADEFPDQANAFDGTYLETIRNLIPGNVYKFRVALKNDYGLSWYSNDSEPVDALALQPSISNLQVSTKLFNNIITWDVNTETVNNENLQTVYNYDILKYYFDADNYIFQPMDSFNNFHKDLSGVLPFSKGSLVGQQFTGPYNPIDSSNNLNPVSNVTLIDNDISLNFFYKYEVIAKNRTGTVGQIVYKTVGTPDGKPVGLDSSYNVADASFNFIWKLVSDIADNTTLTWDISWQEIRKDGSTGISSEIIDYLDPYSRDGEKESESGKNVNRFIGIDLSNNHLQADASYNFQIKGQYDISINEAGWVFDISSQSITADIGTPIIQPKPWSLNLTTPLRITEDKGVSGEQVNSINDFSGVLINSLQNVNLLELELTTTGEGAEPSGITIFQDGYKIWDVSVNPLNFSSLSQVDISQGGYTKGQLFSPLQNYWEIDLSGAAQSFDFSLGADISDPALNVIIRQGENLVTLDISMDNVDDFSGVNIGDLLTHSDGFRSSIGKVAKTPKTVWLLGVDNESQSHSAGTIVWQQSTSTYPPNIANSTARGILRYDLVNPGQTNPVIIESDISENFTISDDPSGTKYIHFQNTTDDLYVLNNSVSKFITIDASLNNWYDFSNNPVDLSLNNIFINSNDISSATTQIVGYDASGILDPSKSLFTEVSSGVYNFTKLAVNTETLDITFTDTKDLLIPTNTLNRDISSIYIGDISKNNQLKLEIITDLSNVNIISDASDIQIGSNIIDASDILEVTLSQDKVDISGTLAFPLTGVDISNIYINCASDIEFYTVRDLKVEGVQNPYTISHNKITDLSGTYGKTTDISLSSYSNDYDIDTALDFTLGSYTIPGGQYSFTSSDGYSEGALKTHLVGTGMIGFFVLGNGTEKWHTKRDLEISGNIVIPFDSIIDVSHINQNYPTTSSSTQITDYSNNVNNYDVSGVFVYYNYQQPPILNNVSYNSLTHNIDMNWEEPTIPDKPYYYDISFSHSSISDISYNYSVTSGSTLTDPSNNGKNYYPGSYNVNMRAAYGEQVPVDGSLFSEWSNDILLNSVPEHSPNILTSELYYNDVLTTFTTDVSHVKLSWDNVIVDSGFQIPNYPIPKNYTLERQTASKDYNYELDLSKDISGTDISYNDYVMYSISGDKTAPRIYRYTLKSNYETSNVTLPVTLPPTQTLPPGS